MKASRLRQRVTLYNPVRTSNPMGGSNAVNFAAGLTISASIEPLSVKDVLTAQAADSQTTVRCILRYRTDITTKTRVGHRGIMYAIDGDPLPDAVSGLEYITLMLKSVP